MSRAFRFNGVPSACLGFFCTADLTGPVFAHAVQWSFSSAPESNFKSNYLPLKSWKKSWKAPESNFHSMFSGPKSWIISWNIEYPESNLWIICSTQCSTFTPRKLGRGVGFSNSASNISGLKSWTMSWTSNGSGRSSWHAAKQAMSFWDNAF